MQENDIKTALEICGLQQVCTNCPYDNCGDECIKAMATDTLELINRQQAEITELTEKLNGAIAGQETLQNHIQSLRCALDDAAEELELERAKNKPVCNPTCNVNILHQERTGEPLDC